MDKLLIASLGIAGVIFAPFVCWATGAQPWVLQVSMVFSGLIVLYASWFVFGLDRL